MSTCTVEHLVLGMIQTNVYLIRNDETKQVIVVDPADHMDRIMQQAQKMEASIGAILLTHGHFDHIKDAQALREATGAKIYAMDEEKEVLETVSMNLSAQFGSAFTVQADEFLHDGQKVEICGLTFMVMHTPGHTKGCGSYYMPDAHILICGDTMFAEGGYGRYDLPTGDVHALIKSLREKLLLLPDETRVLPGHGGESTIGQEKRYNGVI